MKQDGLKTRCSTQQPDCTIVLSPMREVISGLQHNIDCAKGLGTHTHKAQSNIFAQPVRMATRGGKAI